jgi:hypothetical protein
MDLRYFLDRRLAFIEQLYLTSTAPFIEQKRKIEAEEEPFIPPYSEDFEEPAFLSEWLEAEESIQTLGLSCVSMLSAALHLYFKEWERELGIRVDDSLKPDFKNGWLHGYKAYFSKHFQVDFENNPCQLALFEELILVRNQAQHPDSIVTQDTRFSKHDLKKVPSLFFIADHERELLDEADQNERGWLSGPAIHINADKLRAALSEVARFAKWMEQL